jgi:IPT/TIG domain-containing protein
VPRALVFLVCFLITTGLASAATPVILSLDPPSAIAGTSSFTLTVNGANFAGGAVVRVSGSSQSTTFVSPSKLTATILSTFIANAGTLQITVTNPGTPASSAVAFNVLPNNPQIDTLDPPSVPVGSQPVTVRVNGSNFGSTANVRVNGIAHGTTFVSDSELTFVLAASDVSKTGNLSIVVANPNSRLSNSVTLPVTTGATPTITLISPSSVSAGGGAFSLKVVGAGFASGALVKVNGASRATAIVDAAHLIATILSSDVSKAGSLAITVANLNGAVSNAETLTVTNGSAPSIQSLSPSSVSQGAQPFTLAITGTKFISGARVTVGNTAPRNATLIDAQHLTAPMFASDVVNQGSLPVTVTTNGGVSNALTFTVVSQFAPLATSMTPSSVPAGSATFKLLITGSKFESDDVVKFNGTSVATEFISATQIAATIPSDDVVLAGSAQITVVRKDGSGTSAPLTLTITAGNVPAIASLSPPGAAAGSGALTLVISGHNFTTASAVVVDDEPRDTTFIGTTELRVIFTASELATPHDYQINVVNPGGLVSPPATFSVTTPVPAITGLSPDTVISGDAAFLLSVAGDNLSASSVINVNGIAHATQFAAGVLTTTITAAEIAGPGTLAITVSDHGATSAPATLKVLRPTITQIDPGVLVIGSPSATIHVEGTAFLPTSKVLFKTIEQPTKANDDGSLTATINGADLVTPGDFAVNVRNSASSLSVPVNISVVSPGTPEISAVSPVTIGASVLTVDGAHFVPLSVVRINGADRLTTFVSGTQLRAQLETSDTATLGAFTVTVRNPDGAVSTGVAVPVTGPPVILPRRRGARH